jgi:hypothetical protein
MKDSELHISIGSESSEEELKAVSECFDESGYTNTVQRNYVRASAGDLPMVIMVVAWGVASNAVWDIVKFAVKRLIDDPRLQKRKPTVVVKRKGYDAIVTEDKFQVRQGIDGREFDTFDELVKYTQELDKKAN